MTMKTITLKIQQLGAIRDSVVELSRVMLFSGESGLGKSYLAMLCHYFYALLLDSERLNRFIIDQGWNFNDMRPNFKGKGTALVFRKNELEKWMAQDAMRYLSYMLNHDLMQGNLHVVLPVSLSDQIPVQFEEELVGIQNNEEVYTKLTAFGITLRVKEESLGEESPFAFLLRVGLMEFLFDDFMALRNAYVFPPSRGPMMTEDIRPLTGLYEQFKNDLQQFSRIPPHPERVDKDLISLFQRVLEGSVSRNLDTYQYSFRGQEIPISAAAASIREIAPLALLVERTDISRSVMMIEEPEAHLHPLKQRTMADITSVMCRGGATMQITTHSDYYLRRINELMLLYRLHQKCNNDDEFVDLCKQIPIDPRLELNPAFVSAYLLERQADGTSRAIRQSLDDGVPFASFSQAIEESLNTRYKLNQFAEKYGCN